MNNGQEDDQDLWTYQAIKGNRLTHLMALLVDVLCDNSKETWEPLSVVKKGGSMDLTKYSIEKMDQHFRVEVDKEVQ